MLISLVLSLSLAIGTGTSLAMDTGYTGGGDDVYEAAEQMAEEGGSSDGYIVRLEKGTSVAGAAENEGIEKVKYASRTYRADSLEDIKEAFSEDSIEYIEPDYTVTLFDDDMQAQSATAPNDTYYTDGYQWNLDQMNVEAAWQLGAEGQDMDPTVNMDYDGNASNDKAIIAVVDSGLKVGHEDIDWDHVLEGRNFTGSSSSSPTDTDDTLGHGTFCTGLIMGTKDNGVGIAGIAQDVYVMPLKVFQSRSAATSVIVSAISYAAQQRKTFNETQGQEGTNISVMNLSLGGESASTSMTQAVNDAIDAGIIVICAAGNDGDATASYPAQDAIGIGATDQYGKAADFSQRLSLANGQSYANKVWVAAPGKNVTSLYYRSTDSYYTASGTSFSSPEVAALAALSVSLRNDLTTYYEGDSTITNNHEAFKQLLKDTATPADGNSGKINGQDVEFGWGLVNYETMLTTLVGDLSGDSRVTINVKNEAGTTIPGASITVTDPEDGSVVVPDADSVYLIQRGHRYQYKASASKYDTKEGILVSLFEERDVDIQLAGRSYMTRFAVYNTRGDLIQNPEIKVTRRGGMEVSQNSDGSFSTRNGMYQYTVNAGGYFETSGSFTIDDLSDERLETEGMLIPVTVHGDIDVCSTKLTVIGAEGDDITNETKADGYRTVPATTMELTSSDGTVMTPHTDGYYKLPPDTYYYTVKNESYRDVSGSFLVLEEDKGIAQERKIYMTDKLYMVYFDVFPLKIPRVITLINGLGEEEQQVIDGNIETRYRLSNGTYMYRIEAPGYKTYTGIVTVSGKTTTVEFVMEKGDGVVDEGGTDETFIMINNALYALADMKTHATSAEYTIGGNKTEVTGIMMADLISYYTNTLREATSVTIIADEVTYEVPAEEFAGTMISWDEQDQMYLTQDGSEQMISGVTEVTVNYHNHTEIRTVVKEATCTEPGEAQYQCTSCGETRTEVIEPLGHDYDEKTGICTRCGDVYTGENDTTILVNGNTVTSVQLREHTTSAIYTIVDGYTGSSEDHSVVGITLADLVEYFAPDICAKSIRVTANDGYETLYSSDQFSQAMIAWLIDGTAPGTYVGDNHLRMALNGGASGAWTYSPVDFVVNGGSHVYGEPVVTAPTCSKEGYTEKICTVCGHADRYDIVPATGTHVWNEGTVVRQASCTESGSILYACNECGTQKEEIIPARGHSWENGVCTVCHTTQEESLVSVPENADGEPMAVVTAPEQGWKTDDSTENVFTVTGDQPCVVLRKDGDSYELLTPEKDQGGCRYTTKLSAASQIVVLLLGDVNGDALINVADAMMLSGKVQDNAAAEGVNLVCDINHDGSITQQDVSDLLSVLTGKTTMEW